MILFIFVTWSRAKENMGIPDAAQDLSTEMEVDAFRRIFPLRFFERHLSESLRPDGRQLGKARDTIVNLGINNEDWFFLVFIKLKMSTL